MAWYDRFIGKSNPAQERIAQDEGHKADTTQSITYIQAFSKLEVVNRGVNMIVSAASSLDYDVKEKVVTGVQINFKAKALANLLNYKPNPFQSIQDFRNNIFTDFILEGNIFIYFDGTYLYHLPANKVQIVSDPKTYVEKYVYGSDTDFAPSEIIHVKDISSTSIYRGSSRLASADRNINILYKMQAFQTQFFDNNAVMGLIFTSDNTLSDKAKEKTIKHWLQNYSPKNGARKPVILDSGLKPAPGVLNETFKDMDFDVSIKTHDTKILKSLGVPPILLDGGNNANISPNLRLFYLETVIPIAAKLSSAIERYFGFDISPIVSNVSALQPDLKEVAGYYTSLVNGGIITPNEARQELRYEKIPDGDTIRIPANIAGSAADPSQGGAPTKDPND